jgi:hypothetical protein
MPLHCYTEEPMGEAVPQTGVFLKHEGASVYIRTRPQSFALLTDATPVSSSNTIFISKRVRRAGTTAVNLESANTKGSNLGAVYFAVPGMNAHVESGHHIGAALVEVEPKDLWDAHNNVFLTRDMRYFTAFLRFQIRGLNDFGGEFVVVYGFTENVSPWVLLSDGTDELFGAAVTRDFRRMAKIGAARGSLRNRDQYLRISIAGQMTKIASIKLQCNRQVRNKEMALVLKLSFYKGSRVVGFLFRD